MPKNNAVVKRLLAGRKRYEHLHAELKTRVNVAQSRGNHLAMDEETLKRLKRNKLRCKDAIVQIDLKLAELGADVIELTQVPHWHRPSAGDMSGAQLAVNG